MKSGVTVLSALGTFACASLANAGIPVVYSSVTGQATATVPTGPGLAIAAEFTSFSRPTRSPDGTRWIFQAETGLPATENRVIVLMNGLTGSTVLREGQEAPWLAPGSGETLGGMNSVMGVNDNGLFAFGVNTDGTSTSTTDDYIIRFDGANYIAVVQQGAAVPPSLGLPGQTWGTAQNGIHTQPDGSIAFYNTVSAGGSRCVNGNAIVAQSTVTVPTNQPGGATSTFSSITDNTYGITPDGANHIYQANLATVQTVIHNGRVAVRVGDAVAGLPNAIASFNRVLMMSNSDWFVRGLTATDSEDFVIRNGTVVATTGAPIHTGATELYDDTITALPFFLSQGNNLGDYVIVGTTNNPDTNLDTVMVLNNTSVIAREGDPVDVNNNNIDDDDAFIAGFAVEGGYMTDDAVTCIVTLRTGGKGAPAGSAIIRLPLAPPVEDCPADINGDDQVNVADLLTVISTWGACPVPPTACPSDIAPIGGDGQVNVADLLSVISSWGACP